MQELQSRLTDKATFLRNVGTAHQRRFGGDERDAIMGDYATLDELNDCLGDNTAQQWLAEAVADLSAFSGAKNLSGNQVDQVSRLIAQEYHDLKYSEVALFFHRFKCGDYGKFYGGVDPLDMMVALKEYSQQLKEKRWKFANEEYEAKKEALEEEHRQQYQHWKECQEVLCSAVSKDVSSKSFEVMTFESYSESDGLLVQIPSYDAYELLENYTSLMGDVMRKYFGPCVKLRDRILSKMEK